MGRIAVACSLLVVLCTAASEVAHAIRADSRANSDDTAERTVLTHLRSVRCKHSGAIRREVFTSDASDEYLETARAADKKKATIDSRSTVSYTFPPLPDNEEWIVKGTFADSMLSIGWNVLDIESNPTAPDLRQAYEAGHLEGYATALQIHQHMFNRYNGDPVPQNVLKFFTAQDYWQNKMINANYKKDPYWMAAKILRHQLQGILEGAVAANISGYPELTYQSLMTVVAMGDIFDLIPALNPSISQLPKNDWRKMSRERFEEWFTMNGHCSACVSVSDDFSDLFFGHSSWYTYTATLRVFKRFNLNYNATAARRVSFSSYPGMMSSFDDFLVTDKNIMALETSLSVFNTSIYEGNVVPESVLYWMRNMIANYMSSSAKEWGQYFSRYHSGTYNSQWLALDLNLFTPKQDLLPDTLWITEEMPGLIKSRDVTDILGFGYFPSYNVPLIPEIYNYAGYPEAVTTQGPQMTDYRLCVRAQIFRRDAAKVQTLNEFQHLLQYNDYQHDPISDGNPYYAIASRVDLSPKSPQCFGAIDSKTSSWSQWMKNGNTILAFSGPTPQQATFGFDISKAECTKHVGLPDIYNFTYMNMSSVHATPVPQQ